MNLRRTAWIFAAMTTAFISIGCCSDKEYDGNDVLPYMTKTVDEFLAPIVGDKAVAVTWNPLPDGTESNGVKFPPFLFEGPDEVAVTIEHGDIPFTAAGYNGETLNSSCGWAIAETPITVRLRTDNGRLDEVFTTPLRGSEPAFFKGEIHGIRGSLGQYEVPLQSNQKQYGAMHMQIGPDGAIVMFDFSIEVFTGVEGESASYSGITVMTIEQP